MAIRSTSHDCDASSIPLLPSPTSTPPSSRAGRVDLSEVMRGLPGSPELVVGGGKKRSRRCSPHTAIVVVLAALLALAVLLPARDSISHLSTSISTTVQTWTGTTPVPVIDDEVTPELDTEVKQEQIEAAEAVEEAEATPVPAPPTMIRVGPMLVDTSLPPCNRTYTHIFRSSKSGFNGQMGFLVRSALIAERRGYSLLLDDYKWIYGEYTDYFEPFQPDCRPADDWRDHKKMEKFRSDNEENWTNADRIYGPEGPNYIDKYTLKTYVEPEFMDQQHRLDIEEYPLDVPLSSAQTIPPFFRDIYKAQIKAMKRLWRPNAALRKMIDTEIAALGWNLTAWDDRPRRVAGDIVIGAHVRMGDKCHESRNSKLSPLRFAKALLGHNSNKASAAAGCDKDGKMPIDDRRAQAYFDATAAEINAILAQHAGQTIDPAQPDYRTDHWTGEAKPTMIIMSDEAEVLTALKAHKGASVFRLVHTVNADIDQLEHGFNSITFNQLDMADRVKVTRPMVRDMELLSRHAGGLVIMATSNVGRILALLPSFDEVAEGRLMSVDTRWYPTTYYN